MEYPAQWFAPTGAYQVVGRAGAFMLMQRAAGKGVVRCFVYSLTDATIEPGCGRILTMAFAPQEGVPEGDYTLHMSNIRLGTPTLTDKYAGSDEQCAFSVKNWLRGDVNGDGRVDVADINALIGVILGHNPAELYEGRALVNDDDRVDVADVNTLIGLILHN